MRYCRPTRPSRPWPGGEEHGRLSQNRPTIRSSADGDCVMDRIGVGVIGASVNNPGWATAVHIPAITMSDEFVLRAVSTSTPASAAAASAKFSVPAFDSVDALIATPGVDLVVVAVKV